MLNTGSLINIMIGVVLLVCDELLLKRE